MNSPVNIIREHVQKHDLADIVRQLHGSLDRIGEHLIDLRQDQADFKPGGSEWSVGEVIYHVNRATRGMVRISNKLNQGEEFKRPMDRSAAGVTQHGVPLETLRQDWEAMRQDLRAQLGALAPPLNTQVAYAHIDFGPLNAAEWLVLSYLHNRQHHAQIERIKAAAGFPR